MASRKRVLMRTLEQQVIETIAAHKLIQKGDGVLCALSGGADSVFLLKFLSKYQQYYKIKIAAIHIHHGLRGKPADEDEAYCRSLCEKFGIPFTSVHKDIKSLARRKKLSVEEAGRLARYTEFRKQLAALQFNKVATAHHADDNLESILLNFIKGCGIEGLRGIAPMLDGQVIRPLLGINKADILSAMAEQNITFRTDESNSDNTFERNNIRNNIIPLLREMNPAITEAAARLADTAREFSDINAHIIAGLREKIVREPQPNPGTGKRNLKGNPVSFSLREFVSAPVVLQTALIRKVVNDNYGMQLSAKIAGEIASLGGKRKGTVVTAGDGLVVTRERDEIYLSVGENELKTALPVELEPDRETKIENYVFTVRNVKRAEVIFGGGGWTEYIDAGNIPLPLTVRYWEKGDAFQPLGMKTRKKLSDFLAEQKIPARCKTRQLVVCAGDIIIWVPGVRISELCRLHDETTKIFKMNARKITQRKN